MQKLVKTTVFISMSKTNYIHILISGNSLSVCNSKIKITWYTIIIQNIIHILSLLVKILIKHFKMFTFQTIIGILINDFFLKRSVSQNEQWKIKDPKKNMKSLLKRVFYVISLFYYFITNECLSGKHPFTAGLRRAKGWCQG